MAEEAGIIYLEAGGNVQSRRSLGSNTHEQLNNAQGSDGTYVNFIGKPDQSEVGWVVPKRTFKEPGAGLIQAHRGPGELLYVSIDARAADALVSANCSLELHEEIVNAQTGESRQATHVIGDRVTSLTEGGVADNANTVPGQKTPFIALRALGPHEYGAIYGFAQVVTADI